MEWVGKLAVIPCENWQIFYMLSIPRRDEMLCLHFFSYERSMVDSDFLKSKQQHQQNTEVVPRLFLLFSHFKLQLLSCCYITGEYCRYSIGTCIYFGVGPYSRARAHQIPSFITWEDFCLKPQGPCYRWTNLLIQYKKSFLCSYLPLAELMVSEGILDQAKKN